MSMSQCTTPELEAALLARYQEIGHNPPEWAYPLAPSIPFVGRRYGSWGGLLVYASAENLTHYERDPERIPEFLKDERRFNRHRASATVRDKTGFFPNVHMAPFSNGSLLVAAAFYVLCRFKKGFTKPVDLLESIAAANVGKFSIAVSEKQGKPVAAAKPKQNGKVPKPHRNKDYAGKSKLNDSVPYLRADLEVLKPAVVMIPRTMLRNKQVAQVFNESGCEVVPIYQFNATIVNCALAKHDKAAKKLAKELAGTPISDWIDQLRGYTPGYPYRYLVELTNALGD